MKKTIFVITSIFLMVSCVEKTQKSENKTSKKEIEPQNNSISVFDTKIKYPPFLEETSFDYFNSAENDTVSEIKNLEIKNYFNDSSHVYLNYEIPFSKNFKTFVFSYFENENQVLIAVNYGGLDVEEFGSVYEGLLELQLTLNKIEGSEQYSCNFDSSNERGKSGSHYTPEELVQPLIKHSLEYLIEDRISSTRFSFNIRKTMPLFNRYDFSKLVF
jgi:hypothetical protein